MIIQNLYAPEVYAWRAYSVKRNVLSAKKALGKRLRARREEADLTQAQVAEMLDVSQESVSRWEGGVTAIGIAELTALAKLLQAPMGWLLAGEGEAPRAYRVVRADPKVGLTQVTRQDAEKRKGRA